MEPAVESIVAVLDTVLADLDFVDGSDFDQLLSHATERYYQICLDMSRNQKKPVETKAGCEDVMSRLKRWKYTLQGANEKLHMDSEVLLIGKFQSNNVISLSEDENNFLKLKKERRINDLKYQIDKLIIKLDELTISFEQKLEDVALDLPGDEIRSKKDLMNDIERRYKAAVSTELVTPSEYKIKETSKEDFLDSQPTYEDKHRDEETNIKNDSEVKYDHDKYEKEVRITEIESDNIQHAKKRENKTSEKPLLKEPEENLQIMKVKSWEKSSMKSSRDEYVDPVVWTKYRYTVKNGEFPDMDVGCIISTCKGTFTDKDLVVVTARSLDEVTLKLDPTFEVLSNFIQIEPASLDVEFDIDFPWKVSVPYLMIRNMSKEVVIICHDMTTDTTMILDTQDLIFDDNKEGGFKLAEAVLPSPSCVCVVVCKRRIEKFKIDKRGNKFVSNIDPRVILSLPPNCVKINVNFEMSVLQIESGQLNDLVSKIALNNLYSMSPIVEIKCDYPRNFLKTVSMQIPIPNTPAHSSRGRAVSARPQATDKPIKRSKSAITRQISTEEDPIIKVGIYNFQEKVWKTNHNLNFVVNKNKDSVEIDIQNLSKQRFVVVRCDENFNDDQLYRSIDTINKGFETRVVQFVVRQHVTQPSRIVIVTAHPNRMDKIQKALTQENFGEDTSLLSSEFTILERSKIIINCKGNLEIEGSKVLTHRYNSQLPNRKEFYVKEIDKFAQKSKDSYQGFVLISEIKPNNVTKLWEAVINIPKTDYGSKKESKDINDFDFHATDIINKHYLRFLAQELGKDWMMLGKSLKVAEVTIRRISNNPSIDGQTMAYECLLKWIKNATVYSNKAIVMEKALRSIGRFDLVQDLARRVIGEK